VKLISWNINIRTNRWVRQDLSVGVHLVGCNSETLSFFCSCNGVFDPPVRADELPFNIDSKPRPTSVPKSALSRYPTVEEKLWQSSGTFHCSRSRRDSSASTSRDREPAMTTARTMAMTTIERRT